MSPNVEGQIHQLDMPQFDATVHESPQSGDNSLPGAWATESHQIHESPQSGDNNLHHLNYWRLMRYSRAPTSRGASVRSKFIGATWPSNSYGNTSFRKPIDELSIDFLRFESLVHDAINSRNDR